MRNVVVTGGTRGIGLAIVRNLSRAGYQVIAVARRETEALSVAATEGSVVFRACDLSRVETLQSLAKSIRQDLGPIYGLVNNAGIGTAGILANMSDAKISQLVSVNVLSPITFTRHVVRGMLAEGNGRIINMSSIVASRGFKSLTVYSATKASLIGFTRSLARELGSVNITVNAVAPGFIETEMTQDLDDDAMAKVRRRSPLGRMPDVDDVADAVGFLMSDKARNITGTVLTVDAGSTL